MDMFRLAIPPHTADGLRLARIVDLLGGREERREEDRVVGTREVGATRALIHDVEKQDTLVRVVLVLLEGLGSLGCGSFDLEVLNLGRIEGLADLLHEIGELNEDQDTLILRNAFSANTRSKRHMAARKNILT